jgi:hypothetical protein
VALPRASAGSIPPSLPVEGSATRPHDTAMSYALEGRCSRLWPARRIDAPLPGDALELVKAAILEGETRPRDEIPDGL